MAVEKTEAEKDAEAAAAAAAEALEKENAEKAAKELADAQAAIEAARIEAEANGDKKTAERLDKLESRIDELTVFVAKLVPDESEVIDVENDTPPPPKDGPENLDAPVDKIDEAPTRKRFFV